MVSKFSEYADSRERKNPIVLAAHLQSAEVRSVKFSSFFAGKYCGKLSASLRDFCLDPQNKGSTNQEHFGAFFARKLFPGNFVGNCWQVCGIFVWTHKIRAQQIGNISEHSS